MPDPELWAARSCQEAAWFGEHWGPLHRFQESPQKYRVHKAVQVQKLWQQGLQHGTSAGISLSECSHSSWIHGNSPIAEIGKILPFQGPELSSALWCRPSSSPAHEARQSHHGTPWPLGTPTQLRPLES